jgi:hypothetical protein
LDILQPFLRQVLKKIEKCYLNSGGVCACVIMLKLNLKENWQLLEVQPSQNGSNLPSHKKQFFLYSEYCSCLGSCGTTCAIRQMTLFSYVIPLMMVMAHWPLLFPYPSGQMFLMSSP